MMSSSILIVAKKDNYETKALKQSLSVFSLDGEVKFEPYTDSFSADIMQYKLIILHEIEDPDIRKLYRDLIINKQWLGKLICIITKGKKPIYGESDEIEFHNKPIHLPKLLNSIINCSVAKQVCKPLLYIFDDYNPYLNSGGDFSTQDFAIQAEYEAQFNELFNENESRPDYRAIIRHYSNDILNISVGFLPVYPSIWIEDNTENNLKQIIDNLPLDEVEKNRSKIAAFIIDLEWRPNILKNTSLEKSWKKMGHKAISYLIRRFPEIPCYVYSGEPENNNLLESMQSGARWIFHKAVTHHNQGKPAESDVKYERISRKAIQKHLDSYYPTEYGSIRGLPFPNQLIIDPITPPGKKLLKSLQLQLPVGSCINGKKLQNAISRLFPAAKEVRPVKVLTNGKSKAQATFFVSTSSKDEFRATQFMKYGSWFEILKEYLAYKTVIAPRLNAYAASIIDKPVLVSLDGESRPRNEDLSRSKSEDKSIPQGALKYEITGIPEGYEKIQSFGELIEENIQKPDGGEFLRERLFQTFLRVLLPLYRVNREDVVGPEEKRPLWNWMPNVLPPLFTGQIFDENDHANPANRVFEKVDIYKAGTAWILTANEIRKVQNKLSEKALLLFEEFDLLEVDWDSKQDTGELTMGHPDFGFRIRLKQKAKYFSDNFNKPGIRLGFPLSIAAILEEENAEIIKYKSKIIYSYLNTDSGKKTGNIVNIINELEDEMHQNFVNPFDVFFSDKILPYHYCIKAHKGSIHGDLNPNNILFSDKEELGWLIDFEHSEKEGMIAFDLAKMEIEIINHFLIPALVKFALALDDSSILSKKKLLLLALEAVEFNDAALFKSKIESDKNTLEPNLYTPITNLLQVIMEVRKFALKTLDLSNTEYKWALSVYSFIALKFTYSEQLAPLLSFMMSGYYLAALIPAFESDTIFQMIRYGHKSDTVEREVDNLLIRYINNKEESIKVLTQKMSEPAVDHSPVSWGPGDPPERWDLASTGCVANMTPIWGYLWLMVKAQLSKDATGEYKTVVPKISSRGGSCGTVDILESGGFPFQSDSRIIIEECKQNGGVLCKQDSKLTPIDKVFMERRKTANLMKNFKLTYASIISKKIAMGINNVIVDVKVGKDTKIFTSGEAINNVQFDTFAYYESKDLLIQDKELHKKFLKLLSDIGGGAEIRQTNKEQYHYCFNEEKYLRDYTESREMNIRWFFTNADIPQGRAIGRKLILAYLEGVFHNDDNMITNDITRENRHYTKLYLSYLPEICDIRFQEDDCWQLIKSEWEKLSEKLISRNYPTYAKINKYKSKNEISRSVKYGKKKNLHNLKRVTFRIEPYHIIGKRNLIKKIEAYYLDILFDWLCGEDPFDEEVGIWLHKLPGEKIIKNDPFITIFYRPDRCSDEDVKRKVRAFIHDKVELGEPNE